MLSPNEGSRWFKRFYKECRKISRDLRFKRVRLGFYRIYWRDAYLHEVWKDMPAHGYTFEVNDPRLENKSFYEEMEDNLDTIQRVKNYIEGYYDSIDKIRTRVYMLKNNREFYEQARRAYQTVVVK